ncbi:regulator of chromosome condensation 1/beta-lactamase-inhibitor protein II [Cokeromyces recurvatus]|uniref:regulator of chromosome condensation 1/beta-lactamase-inhibitor protein II n=1 Tax=Cokeromyces recurvatus TaxID=90255 RepID=UPI0022211BB8|nr:regulator of chromosome condensation 1/beta-lactamase-inhibitor protein II [Cokeromyces recurvatus]KAI7906426.1 regulator of chromosome condensation 1/beta-lactamase-inhibitor protein II [Cokeromyces recurvatus]
MHLQTRLYSFGFNAFQQTGSKSVITKSPTCHTNIRKLLFASWETTIVIDDEGELIIWGFQPCWFEKFKKLCKDKEIQSIFGDPNELLGIIDQEQKLSYVTADKTRWNDCESQVRQAVYCTRLHSIFILKETSDEVYQYDVRNEKSQLLDTLPPVKSLAASNSHVLFLTYSLDAPVYGLGSNRLSQLGMDYQQQEIQQPMMIDYFCGLGEASYVSCGPFHSAVIINGDVYTFGWSKDGRLGSGHTQGDDDIVSLVEFLDVNDQPIDVHAMKVVCGSTHTLVLDKNGTVWSCGSDQYSQLGRELKDTEKGVKSDFYFRACTLFDSKTEHAIDCSAGRWTSFIMTVKLR